MRHRASIQRAAVALRAGGVVAYPTEAVFGLGCDPWNAAAFQKLLQIKGRAIQKGVILIAAGFDQLGRVLDPRYAHLWAAAQRSWPGPITWILPARPGLPRWVTGGRTDVAVRVTAHPVASALCRSVGTALVSTSANRSGLPPLRTAAEVRRHLGQRLNHVVAAKVGSRQLPSEIFHGRTGAKLRG
jgi:L-threonylcarbamoyladenylate synthase